MRQLHSTAPCNARATVYDCHALTLPTSDLMNQEYHTHEYQESGHQGVGKVLARIE